MNVFEGFTERQQWSANNRFQRTALRTAAEPERRPHEHAKERRQDGAKV